MTAGFVRLRCSKPPVDQTLRLSPDPPKIIDGVGGWETIGRPRQTAMTIWSGNPPYQLEVGVVLDAYSAQGSVETPIAQLLAAGRGDEESEPSTWTIDGIPGLPAGEWVLNGAEPGDLLLRRPGDMERARQSYTLQFLEYVDPTYALIRGKALQGLGPSTLYRVKRGDTPASIARKRRISWTVLRQLNPTGSHKITSANQKLKEGWRIRVPVLKRPAKRRKARS
jgi:hypothetical protein